MCCNQNNRCCMNDCDRTDGRSYACRPDCQVFKHRHVIKHRHDIINEYDVVHEHDYHYRDVVKTREVVKHHDHIPYNPNYCGEDCDERNDI